MQTIEIAGDMDAAAMLALKPIFEEIALADSDICLDMANVRFLDSSGLGGIVFLYKRLRSRSQKLSLANVAGQPANLMRHLQLGFLIDALASGAAA